MLLFLRTEIVYDIINRGYRTNLVCSMNKCIGYLLVVK